MSYRGGGGYASRDGLNPRAHPGASDQVQISIDPKFDFDQQVDTMRGSVARLKEMTMAIDQERKEQGQMINNMELDMERARMVLHSARKRLNIAYHRAKSNHMLHLVLFVVALVLGVYMLARMYRLSRAITG